MKKILPIAYVLYLYFVLINPVYLEIMDVDLSMWVAVVLGVVSIFYSFYIKDDEKAIGFAFYFSTFALIPFYILVTAMFLLVGFLSTNIDHAQSIIAAVCVALIINNFVLFTNAFYGLNYARHHKLETVHKLMPFVLIFNVIDAVYLTRRMFHVKHD